MEPKKKINHQFFEKYLVARLKGLYYKTLHVRNSRQMARFFSKRVSFLLSVTNALVWANTLAYFQIRKLRISNVFIEQTPEGFFLRP
jgi:hypothetical protein